MKHYCYNVCATIFVCVLLLQFTSCKGSGNEEIPSIDYLPVKITKGGNWSMIDRNGKIIYEDEFKNEPSPVTEGVFAVLEGDTYTLYKVTDKAPTALPGCEGFKQVGAMAEGVIPVVFPNERIHLRDKNGVKICELKPFEGHEVARCEPFFNDGLLAAAVFDDEMNLKWGFIDKTGQFVISPQYPYVGKWGSGLCVCATEEDDDNTYSSFKVIDRKGNEVFDIDDDYRVFARYMDGHLLLSNDEQHYIVDTQGKKKKLPTKIHSLIDFNGTYIIFSTKDDEYGVADIDGEICIRPKYSGIAFGLDGKYVAKKNGKDEFFVLDDKGETVMELDYKDMDVVPGFAYKVEEGKHDVLLGKDFKPLTEDELYLIGDRNTLDFVYDLQSDYFDSFAIANRFVNMVRKDGFGKYNYGETGGYALYGDDMQKNLPKSYMSDAVVGLATNKRGVRYIYNIVGFFSENLTRWSDGRYRWNEDSKLSFIRLLLYVPEVYLRDVYNFMEEALKAKGLYVVSEEYTDGRRNKLLLSWNSQSKFPEMALIVEKDRIIMDMCAERKPQDVDENDNQSNDAQLEQENS